jgi:hypothetical protein
MTRKNPSRVQIEHATAYALKKGWTVSEDHIYADEGISGASSAIVGRDSSV